MVQLSFPYLTTGKIIALPIQTFVGKVISLLFNMLSRLVIVFLPKSKCLLISWLQSPSAVILEPKKIKALTVSIVSPSICHEVMGPDAKILVFWMLSFKPVFLLSSFTFIKMEEKKKKSPKWPAAKRQRKGKSCWKGYKGKIPDWSGNLRWHKHPAPWLIMSGSPNLHRAGYREGKRQKV